MSGRHVSELVSNSLKSQPGLPSSEKQPYYFRHWKGVLFLLFLLMLIGLTQTTILGMSADAFPVIYGRISEHINASGQVISPHDIFIRAETNGRVKNVMVSLGQEVKSGQILVQLEDDKTLQVDRDHKLKPRLIASPQDGIVVRIDVFQGDDIQLGKNLLLLSSKGETEVEVGVKFQDLAKLSVGQTGLVSLDGSNQSFQAKVTSITSNNLAVDRQARARLKVDMAPPYFREGMAVSVEIVTTTPDEILVIPKATVHDVTTSPWVMVIRENVAVRQPVRLGIQDNEKVEVLSGLLPGDFVIPISQKFVKSGDKVHAHPIGYTAKP